jgi:spermidine synthase
MNIFPCLQPKVIATVKSRRNGPLSIVQCLGKRKIIAYGAEQSGGTIVPMWKEAVAALYKRNRILNSSLILGLGGGTVINALEKKYSGMRITVIEYDQEMIDVARKYFGMENGINLHIICDDAFSYVRRKKGREKFDLIIMDLFTGKYNPGESRQFVFLKQLKNLLQPGGYILYNSHYDVIKKRDLEILLEKCRKVFHTAEIVVKYKYSRILLLH